MGSRKSKRAGSVAKNIMNKNPSRLLDLHIASKWTNGIPKQNVASHLCKTIKT